MDKENAVYSPLTFRKILKMTDCIFEDNVGVKDGILYYRIRDKNSPKIVFQTKKENLPLKDFKRAFIAFAFNDHKTPVGILVNGSNRIVYETTVKSGTKFKDFEAIGICRSEAEFNIRKDILGINL